MSPRSTEGEKRSGSVIGRQTFPFNPKMAGSICGLFTPKASNDFGWIDGCMEFRAKGQALRPLRPFSAIVIQ